MAETPRGSTAVALLLLVGCATARQGKPVDTIAFDPMVITPGPSEEMALAGMNDEELFAWGEAQFAASDFQKAARAFGRLADTFPQSFRRPAAIHNAGLALMKLERWSEALERFRSVAEPERGTGDAVDAAFKVAECLYHLQDFPSAIAVLSILAARQDLSEGDQLQALTQEGICESEAGDLTQAEKTLRSVLRRYEQEGERERLDDYYPAQAQFFLGEIYRTYFSAVELDPDVGEAKLTKDLEYKCEMLLSAQGHYLRAIRMGNARWSIAAGLRVGTLYEELYDKMVHARVPSGLEGETAEMYRTELRKKIRVLVEKAIAIYERTLAAAERVGEDSPFVAKTRESLERVKSLLLSEEGIKATGA